MDAVIGITSLRSVIREGVAGKAFSYGSLRAFCAEGLGITSLRPVIRGVDRQRKLRKASRVAHGITSLRSVIPEVGAVRPIRKAFARSALWPWGLPRCAR